jgi:hypothetical protein
MIPLVTSHARVVDGVTYVWSILDNAWVTLAYWRWVNDN